MSRPYTGRFAPSPTGPLHFGSLVAATAGYLDARAHRGRWLVRMEDIDTPRVEPGADRHILETLTAFGFVWDGDVLYQSARIRAYQIALDQLLAQGDAYACGCARRETQDRYPGACRNGLAPGKIPRAKRFRVNSDIIEFEDRVQGPQRQNVEAYCGDFIIHRADGLFAYQLAVVVDDRDQGVTDIIRGADLLDSTARQISLQRRLGAPTPRYLHTPVVVDTAGQKLSKQTRAPAIHALHAIPLLRQAIRFLGQSEPPSDIDLQTLWNAAIHNWKPGAIPRSLSLVH